MENAADYAHLADAYWYWTCSNRLQAIFHIMQGFGMLCQNGSASFTIANKFEQMLIYIQLSLSICSNRLQDISITMQGFVLC